MTTKHQIAFAVTTDPEGRTVLAASGRVDLRTGPMLRRQVDRLARPGQTLVIDLRDVSYMDSPGLGTIIYCDRLQRERGGQLVVKNPTGEVRELFDVVQLANIIPVE
jgi:anti-anti-sigma factor